MKFLLPFLMLALCGCHESQRANLSLEKRQEAIGNEIISIEYDFGNAVFKLNNANAASFVAEAESLADRLDKISKDLDTLGRFPIGLRKATMKKSEDSEKILNQLMRSRKVTDPLRPEVAKTTNPAVERFFSASASVMMKAGLYYYTTNSTDTNGVELSAHP